MDLETMLDRSTNAARSADSGPAANDRFLATLISNLPGMVYRCENDPRWPMSFVSEGCLDITGWSSEDFVERRVDLGELILPEDRRRVWEQVQAAVAEPRPYLLTYRIRSRDDRERWLWEKGCGVFDERGELECLEGVILDISQQKALEEQLLQGHKLEAVGRLAGGVAHDFNNLLTAILGYADMLAAQLPDGSDARGHARQILRAAQRAADLTRRLLTFARKQPAAPKVFDLSELVLSVDALLRRLLGEDIELVSLLAREPVLIEADPGQIEQVLVNLAVNARQAMPYGGRLSVEVAPGRGDPPSAVLTVSDTGMGMDEQTLARVFEPFFTTKPGGEGTGLGLAICREIVQRSGGEISAASEPGRGSRFRVRLPRVRMSQGTSLATASDEPAPGRGETVLLVEDESLVRQVALAALEELGYRVLEARSGAEALELARRPGTEVDALVTDLALPLVGGVEVARLVLEVQPRARVLFISGYGESHSLPTRIGERSAAFLPKPFTPRTLGAAVRSLLEPRPDRAARPGGDAPRE